MSRIDRARFQSVRGGGLLTVGGTGPSLRAGRVHVGTGRYQTAEPIASTSRETLDLTISSDEEQEFEEVSPAPKRVKLESPALSEPVPPKPRAKAKPKPTKAKVNKLRGTVEWPDYFKKLERVFKALNTVYTFASARKSLATTFEMLKASVERLLGRSLETNDIAQIKALLPEIITFAYTDSDLLKVHAPSAEVDPARAKRKAQWEDLNATFEAIAKGEKPPEEGAEKEREKEVLLFRFNDAELKTGEKYRKHGPKHPKKVKDVQKMMSDLISSRNERFATAVDELLLACAAHNPPHDPIELLLEATAEHIPLPPQASLEPPKGVSERMEDLAFYQRNPDQRPSIARIIEELKEQDEYSDQIVENGHRVTEAREARYGQLETNLSTELWDALYELKKIDKLYSHQAEAINLLDKGHNVIVSTSTSSGKSLIYQIPVVKELEKDQEATALYIFPTKALAQDQRRALADLLGYHEGLHEIQVDTFDGDTPKEARDQIRDNASVIFANHDIFHVTVLPREEEWRRFFRKLRFVVVDELHYYGGLFGAHVAFVMRRLRRICRAIGNDSVRFISCSATISNPVEHMQALFGVEDVVLVDEDGSPAGRKEHIVWNPPWVDPEDVRQGRVSTITETSRIFRFLMDRGVRCIVFCKVRIFCELLMKQVRADLLVEGRSDVAQRVMAYRSGYSAADRRQIERDMFSGQLLGIVSTTALELGVDIGSLDAVLTVSFPYTLPGLRQQAGRAGRRQKDSLSMLICGPFPLDQHYARNPEEIYTSPFSRVGFDLGNPIVLEGHLQCAAKEMPIEEGDSEFFGESLKALCAEQLIADGEGFWHAHPSWGFNPAKRVPLRASEEGNYSVVDITGGKNEIIEELETSRAIFTTYEGAVYLHQARTFVVKSINHDTKIAQVQRATINYNTRSRDFTNVDPVETLAIREIEGSSHKASYGTVQIESVIFGYFKLDRRNNILDTVDVYSPPFTRKSHGMWVEVPREALELLLEKKFHLAGAIHAAEHAILSLSPVVAMSTEGDIKTECKQPEKELAGKPTTRKRPARLILYDAAGQSSGVCGRAFDHVSVLLRSAADTIANCPCEEGCPSCVSSHLCSGANTILSKLGAMIILFSLLDRPLDPDSIPEQAPLAFPLGPPGGTIEIGDLARIDKGPGKQARVQSRAKGKEKAVPPAEEAPIASEPLPLFEPEEEWDLEPEWDEEAEREMALAEMNSGRGGIERIASAIDKIRVHKGIKREKVEPKEEEGALGRARERREGEVVYTLEEQGGFIRFD